MVRAGLLLLPPFFRLLFCFSLSLFGPRKCQTNINKIDSLRILWQYFLPEFPEEDDLRATQLRSFLRVPSPHRQPQWADTRLYPCFHKCWTFCFSDQFLTFFWASLELVRTLRRVSCQVSKQSLCMNLLWEQALLLQDNFTVLETSKMCSPWAPLKHRNS